MAPSKFRMREQHVLYLSPTCVLLNDMRIQKAAEYVGRVYICF